jgi:hypothetical protein
LTGSSARDRQGFFERLNGASSELEAIAEAWIETARQT